MTLSTLAQAVLIINELMASNVGTAMSPATNFDSWIELYNPTEQPIDLGGMYLSDDANNPTLWRMPLDMGTVPAKGFHVVWLGSNNIKHNQAPFKLDCDGGSLYLSDASGQLIESLTYPAALSHTSYARTTDGSGRWGLTADATPGASNATAIFADKRLSPPVVKQDSKLFTNSITFKVDIPEGTTLVYTTDGSLPQWSPNQEPVKEWTEHVVNGDCEGSDISCLVGKDGDGGGAFATHLVDGVGYDDSRGIKVHSVAHPANDWDTQLFVYTPDHIWQVGERYRFRMKVRADRRAHISVQSHTTPGNYIHWSMLAGGYDVDTHWQEITYEGTITNEQAGWTGMQTIAFNLNELRGVENEYYFDDISWESHSGGNGPISQVSTDGQFTVRATTNFVFRLFKDGYLPSAPVTRSYIKTSNHYTIPVVSIVGDKRYFADPMWGIDTQGTNGRTGNGQSSPCNWNMDWERPVNFSFITPDGTMAYNQDVQISVSGGWTRAANPRSFKLKAGKEFDGQNRLDYAFFPQKPYLRNKVLLLRNGGNDVWENNGSRFLDPALQTIIQRAGINIDLQSYVPIIEYVNGEFRGVLNMREPNNKKFVEANYGYDDELIDMFEMSPDSNVVFMVGNGDVLERIYELGTHATEANTYAELSDILDIDEFINYMAIELYLGSSDWPHNNIKGFRSQDDGRYRFVTFDLDFAFKNSNPFTTFANEQWFTFNYIYDTQEQRHEEIKLVTFFLNMLKNDQFRKRFIDAYCLMGGSVFEKSRASAIVDELADRVRPMMQLDGWRSPDGSANLIRQKLNTLNEAMTRCMQQFAPMQLTSAKRQKVKIGSDTPGARLLYNGQQMPYAHFDGYLFGPVTLEALCPAGHRFDGWKRTQDGTMFSTDAIVALPEENNISLTACFKPLTDDERQEKGIVPVRINEVSASNGIYVNEYWKRNDWLELYNTTDQAVDVAGMYLTDNADKPQKYMIDKGAGIATTLIPPHGHLIVWCDQLEPQSQLHAPFKLAAEGEVMLSAADGTWHDRLVYTRQKGDESVGRYPDGSNDVYVMNVPTIAQPNLTSSYLTAVEQPSTSQLASSIQAASSLTVRYVMGKVIVRGELSGMTRMTVSNLAGQTVAAMNAAAAAQYVEWPVDHLAPGCYMAHITNSKGHVASCKFVKK